MMQSVMAGISDLSVLLLADRWQNAGGAYPLYVVCTNDSTDTIVCMHWFKWCVPIQCTLFDWRR
jgi:hypothetical protein